eukprot:scaffold891_cov274-Chaetoceros_neogracile.AAC.5
MIPSSSATISTTVHMRSWKCLRIPALGQFLLYKYQQCVNDFCNITMLNVDLSRIIFNDYMSDTPNISTL